MVDRMVAVKDVDQNIDRRIKIPKMDQKSLVLGIEMNVYIEMHVYTSKCMCIYRNACKSIEMHVNPSKCMYVHRNACVSIEMHVYPSK